MRIMIATETFIPSTDGVVTRLTYAAKYLSSRGHNVGIICPHIEGVPLDYGGARIFPMPARKFAFYKERAWSLPTKQVEACLRFFKPDIVHAFNPVSLAATAVHYAKKLSIPLICSYHTNVPDYLDVYHFGLLKPLCWWYLRHLHNSAPINFTTSKAMKRLLESKGIHNVRVLPIGLDENMRSSKFKNSEMRNFLSGGEVEKKLLIFVGRLAPEKDVESLLPLIKGNQNLRLAIVGGGPLEEELREKFAGTPTVFTGFLKGEKLAQAFASADAFIFPSTSETLGLVLTEAMASSIPVIATDSPPTVEQISDGENGLIYQKENPSSLDNCIKKLEDAQLIEKIVKNGRKFAKQFSWDRVNQTMLDAYEETLNLYGKNDPHANLQKQTFVDDLSLYDRWRGHNR
ncbi:MAG: glycosyltransferase family 1 protein [Treponemataceae bacterium]